MLRAGLLNWKEVGHGCTALVWRGQLWQEGEVQPQTFVSEGSNYQCSKQSPGGTIYCSTKACDLSAMGKNQWAYTHIFPVVGRWLYDQSGSFQETEGTPTRKRITSLGRAGGVGERGCCGSLSGVGAGEIDSSLSTLWPWLLTPRRQGCWWCINPRQPPRAQSKAELGRGWMRSSKEKTKQHSHASSTTEHARRVQCLYAIINPNW